MDSIRFMHVVDSLLGMRVTHSVIREIRAWVPDIRIMNANRLKRNDSIRARGRRRRR